MPFLTLFTTPKPFRDPHIRTIQYNAIQSWVSLGEGVEVLLVGNETGMAEAAAELGAVHLPQVACNAQGTPLVSSIFHLARSHSRSPLLAYANADILLLPDVLEAARAVSAISERFLLVGQRWDLEVTQRLDYSPGWPQRLREDLQRRGRLHRPSGSDYFLFPRDCFTEIPEFAIGRAGWDNWMIYHAIHTGLLAVDATPSIRAIHQNHDYRHLAGGQPHYDLAESDDNRRLAGGKSHMYILLDVEQQLADGRVRPAPLTFERLVRRLERRLYPPAGDPQGVRRFMVRRLRRLRRGVI
jgi:hypothetical protein